MGFSAIKMDASQLSDEGYYSIFGRVGARTEVPSCSLCLENKARVGDNTTLVSTYTRNFPKRLGNNAIVYLSPELAAVVADTYCYLNFDQIKNYTDKVNMVINIQRSLGKAFNL